MKKTSTPFMFSAFCAGLLFTVISVQNTNAQILMTANPVVEQHLVKGGDHSNVQTRTQILQDIGIQSIDAPFTRCGLSATETVVVTVKNFGTDSVGNFQVSYKVDTSAAVTENYADTLAPGESVVFTFTQTADFSEIKSFELTASTIWAADTDIIGSRNNSKSSTITNSNSAYLDSASIITGFEVADDPIPFTIEPAGTWQAENQIPRTGKRHFTVIKTGAGAEDAWAFAPCLELEAGATYALEFWYACNVVGTINGNIAVKLGRSKDSSAMNTVLMQANNVQGVNYREYKGTFTVDETGGYFFALHETSTGGAAGSYGISIDDFKLRKVRDNSVVVSKIQSPKTGCDLNANEPIVLSLLNNGSADQSNFEVSFKVGTKPAITENYTGTIAVGEEKNFTFAGTADLSSGTIFNVEATTALAVTGEQAKQQVQEVAAQKFPTKNSQLAIDFEDETKLLGWEILDANEDGYKWTRRLFQGQANSGNWVIIYPPAGQVDVDADDWYFSKCLQLDSTKVYRMEMAYKIAPSGDGIPAFDITIGNAQTPDAQTKVLSTFSEDTEGSYFLADLRDIKVPANGIYYIGFHNTSLAGTGDTFLEDFLFKQDETAAVDENALASSVSIYPNPSKGVIKLDLNFDQKQDVTVTVTDMLGKVVAGESYKGMMNEHISLDLSANANGVYFVKVQNADASMAKRVTITR